MLHNTIKDSLRLKEYNSFTRQFYYLGRRKAAPGSERFRRYKLAPRNSASQQESFFYRTFTDLKGESSKAVLVVQVRVLQKIDLA